MQLTKFETLFYIPLLIVGSVLSLQAFNLQPYWFSTVAFFSFTYLWISPMLPKKFQSLVPFVFRISEVLVVFWVMGLALWVISA